VITPIAMPSTLPSHSGGPSPGSSALTRYQRIRSHSARQYTNATSRYLYMRLRKADLDSRFPGLIDAVING
jgi:hypothetical protein